MGFPFLGKKKDVVDDSDMTENIEVNGNDSTQEVNNDNTDKEEEKVAKFGAKKRYMYIALDSEGNAILNQKGDIITRIVEEGARPDWPDDIRKIAMVDKEFRVEVPETPSNLSKNEKEKFKKDIKDKLKAELMELAADRIERAKASIAEKKEKKLDDTVQSGQETAEKNVSVEPTEEKPENSQDEGISASKKDEKSSTSAEEKGKRIDDTPVEKKPQKEEKPVTAEKTETNTVAAIHAMGQQLNGDINDAVEDLIGTMGANNAEIISTMKSCVESQGKRTADTAMRAANDASQMIVQRTQKNTENIISSINDTKKSISETQDKLVSKVNAVGKRVTDMGESIEGIEGNLHRLDQLDTITELLQNKGLTLSMEIPPVNADEEDIINLVRYSQKITEQLGYAARDLIRKREAFKSLEEGNANEQKMMDQKIAKAHDDGVLEGKKSFIKQLISKYEDVDTIRESENNHIHVIWTLLMELGVLIDGDGYYEKGKKIDFSEADIERLIGTYSKLDGAGKYKVVKTGLSFQGEIICKAEFEKVDLDNTEDNPEETTQEKAEEQKKSEESASNENVASNTTSEQSSNE